MDEKSEKVKSQKKRSSAELIMNKHKNMIIDCLRDNGGKCTYEVLVKEGEKHHCDTLGAMVKSLKKKKVLHFDKIFLMYPMHKDDIVTITKKGETWKAEDE
eukprot:TRINITY_DN1722_c0_g1_i1.p1 TRINITY_DN1722_c0_g1~~TRINITY_DN1722_c0_g1_i1.p1  ORF type:complete len:101 (+),score=28.43 TRINITY_DN1722_c0_g1_i1:120-422(+)